MCFKAGLVFLLMLSSVSATASALASASAVKDLRPFDIKAADHQLHVAVSYGLTFTFTEIFQKYKTPRLKSVLYASLTTFALGVAKETVIDREVAADDLVANTVGILLSDIVVLAFEF